MTTPTKRSPRVRIPFSTMTRTIRRENLSSMLGGTLVLLAAACGGPSVQIPQAEEAAAETMENLLLNPDAHAEVAGDAALALAKVSLPDGNASTAKSLMDGLRRRSDESVRFKCVQALGRLGDPSGLLVLDSLFCAEGTPGLLKIETAIARHRLGASDVLPWLGGQLDSSHPTIHRANAAAALGRIGSPEAAPALRAVLEQAPTRILFSSTVLALGRIGDRASTDKIGGLLLHSTDVMTGTVLAEALEQMGHPAAARYLEAGFRNSTHFLLQERCIQGLAALKDRGIVPDLRRLLAKSTIANSRSMAARYLGQLEDSTAVPILKAAFRGDPAEPVKLAAAEALVRLGKGLEIAPELENFLDHANETVKIEAARVLAMIPDPRRLHALRETFLWETNPGTQIAAVRAIGGIPVAKSVETLQEAYGQARDPDLKDEIIRSIGKIPLPESWEALRDILETAEYARVKVRLLEALSRSGDTRQIGILLKYLDDHQPEVRLQAAAGVFRLTRGIEFGLAQDSAG